MNFKRILAKNYINAIGWRTNKRYVLIESDDWGSIRMPSKKVYDLLLSKGIHVDKDYFDQYDSLESTDDLTALFEVLTGVKDSLGHPAVITPLAVSANPNFELIEQKQKKEYIYEPITETYKRHSHTEKSHDLILQGIANGIYKPQFHGREHFHVKRWMEAINSYSFKEQLAYDNQCLIISREEMAYTPVHQTYFPAFAYDHIEELDDLNLIIEDGTALFEKVYGYKASSICPPCGVVNSQILEVASRHGIKGLQAGQHFVPQKDGTIKIINKKWGDMSATHQIYWRRNCTFEPSKNHDLDWVDLCLKEINIAFRWGKPATINSHRVNYIGSIFPKNRDKTLKQLSLLLKTIVKKWPDVEFIDSEKLYNILSSK